MICIIDPGSEPSLTLILCCCYPTWPARICHLLVEHPRHPPSQPNFFYLSSLNFYQVTSRSGNTVTRYSIIPAGSLRRHLTRTIFLIQSPGQFTTCKLLPGLCSMEPGADGKHGAGGHTGDQRRGNGKGKDVVRSETGQVQDQVQAQGPSKPPEAESVMARVGRSAAGLSQSVLHSKPTSSDVASLSFPGKAGPSLSSEPRALGEASSTAVRAGTAGSTGGFRSAQADAHAAAEEAAFSDFLDGTPVFVATEQTGVDQAWQRASRGASEVSGTQVSPRLESAYSVAEQQAQDGVEVVRLLSQVTEEAPDFEAGPTVTEEEMKNLRQALFEEGASAQISATDWNNILNFVPDFLLGESGGPGPGTSRSSHMNLGVTEPAEAGQIWLEQWNRVLTGYTDEVWGDLGSLVEEARTEVARMKDTKDEPARGAPAVRQLRTILTRVRARL